MAKKKTSKKAHAAPSTPDPRDEIRQLQAEIQALETRRARRAIARAREWTQLLDWLEDLLAFGNPDLEACAEQLEGDGGTRPYPSLWSAILHVPMLTDFRHKDVFALEWLDREIGGRHDPLDDWIEKAKPGEILSQALAVVGRLLDHDLAIAKRHGFRSPGDLEGHVLRVLVGSDHGRSSKEIAKLVTKGNAYADDGAVQDAIGRLRHECGFTIPSGRSGYSLTESDRDHAAGVGISRAESE